MPTFELLLPSVTFGDGVPDTMVAVPDGVVTVTDGVMFVAEGDISTSPELGDDVLFDEEAGSCVMDDPVYVLTRSAILARYM